MKVSRRTEEDLTYFVISGLEPKYFDAVGHLFYAEKDGVFMKGFPSDALHLDKCYRNFERYIEEIILQMADVHPVPWDKALLAFLDKTECERIGWWLCGSAALAVRGVEIMPHDIDVITDEYGALKLGEVLQDCLFEPMVDTHGWMCKVFGKAFLYAVVDVAGDVDENVDKPEPSDYGPVAASRLETVEWHSHQIRVPPLDLQLRQCERRGLTDRVREIKQAIS